MVKYNPHQRIVVVVVVVTEIMAIEVIIAHEEVLCIFFNSTTDAIGAQVIKEN